MEDDISAVKSVSPDLAIGTTPVVQKAKELGIPSLYYTNLISARPIMGIAGAGSLAEVILQAIGNGSEWKMKAFRGCRRRRYRRCLGRRAKSKTSVSSASSKKIGEENPLPKQRR